MSIIYIAAAIIRDEANRFLLVRKAGRSLFMLPGGKIEAGETPIQGLLRELKEEIALDISDKIPDFFRTMTAPAAYEDGATVKAELFELNLADLAQDFQPVASHEIEEVQWVAYQGVAYPKVAYPGATYPETSLPLAHLARCVLDEIIARP